MVAEFPKVLKRLEDVGLSFPSSIAFDDLSNFVDGSRVRKVVVELLLDVREVAVVVLDDFGREVAEDVFFESTKKEGEDLLVESFESESGCKGDTKDKEEYQTSMGREGEQRAKRRENETTHMLPSPSQSPSHRERR